MDGCVKPRLAFKEGVVCDFANLDRESIRVLQAAMKTAPDMIDDLVMVTSAVDGQHGENSMHSLGRAWDFRFSGDRPGAIVPDPSGKMSQHAFAVAWARRISTVLGHGHDVIAEKDHVHAEVDRRF